MAKSIQERVRATLAKAEAAAKKAEATKVNRSNGAKLAAAVRRENRDNGIIDGTLMPRNAREDEMQFRALYGDDFSEF